MKSIVSKVLVCLVMSSFAWSLPASAQDIPDITDIIRSECDRLEKECEKLKEKYDKLSAESEKCYKEYRENPLLSSGVGTINDVINPILNWLYFSSDELAAINKKREECEKKSKEATDAYWAHKDCQKKLLEETKQCTMHLKYDLAGGH